MFNTKSEQKRNVNRMATKASMFLQYLFIFEELFPSKEAPLCRWPRTGSCPWSQLALKYSAPQNARPFPPDSFS